VSRRRRMDEAASTRRACVDEWVWSNSIDLFLNTDRHSPGLQIVQVFLILIVYAIFFRSWLIRSRHAYNILNSIAILDY
jgi:hypothetical protein